MHCHLSLKDWHLKYEGNNKQHLSSEQSELRTGDGPAGAEGGRRGSAECVITDKTRWMAPPPPPFQTRSVVIVSSYLGRTIKIAPSAPPAAHLQIVLSATCDPAPRHSVLLRVTPNSGITSEQGT